MFNLFYDSGCGDLVCKKSAIDRLASLGRTSREIPGPVTLSGVGDKKTISQDGIYKITLRLWDGKEVSMSGVCLDKVTAGFPTSTLKSAEKDIREHHQKFGGDLMENCPVCRVRLAETQIL